MIMKKLLLFIFTLLLPLVANADAYNVKIDSIYYNLFDKDKTAEVTSSPNYYSGEVIIPETVTYNDNQYRVTSIGEKAFSHCGLRFIGIPNSVTSIRDYAFSYSAVTFVTLPNSVTTIGDNAFLYCDQLIYINIPNSVTRIGDYAFSWCYRLTPITIPNNVISIGKGAFSLCI